MTLLIVSFTAFVVWHVAVRLQLRGLLIEKLGKSYFALFGLGSLALLVFLLWSYRQADRSLIYTPPEWGAMANYVLSLAGFICLGIHLFRGRMRNVLRYPLAIGALLWGAGHLLSSGALASVVLIAGLVATVLLSTLTGGARSTSEVRQGHDLLGPLFGVAFYALAVQLHQALVGVPVFQLIK